jgi:TPR repeat protein
VKHSDTEAIKWFRKAVEQGNAFAQVNLGWMYDKGRGVAQSDTEAVNWYRKAAKQQSSRAGV